MRENKGFCSFAFYSAHVKYGVWTWLPIFDKNCFIKARKYFIIFESFGTEGFNSSARMKTELSFMYTFCSPKALNGIRRQKKITMKGLCWILLSPNRWKNSLQNSRYALLTSKGWYRPVCCCFGASPTVECLCSTSWFNSSLKLANLLTRKAGKKLELKIS